MFEILKLFDNGYEQINLNYFIVLFDKMNKNIMISASSATSDKSLVGPNHKSANDSGEFNSEQMKEYDMCQDYVVDKNE